MPTRPPESTSRPAQVSASSTGFCSGATIVLYIRIDPVSGISRASSGTGWNCWNGAVR